MKRAINPNHGGLCRVGIDNALSLAEAGQNLYIFIAVNAGLNGALLLCTVILQHEHIGSRRVRFECGERHDKSIVPICRIDDELYTLPAQFV